MSPVLWFKAIHIVAVVVFLGNAYTGIYWKAIGDGTRDPRIMAHTLRSIILSDRLFTLPGVVILSVTGVLGAVNANLRLLQVAWIVYGIALISLSGVIYALFLAPSQRQLHAIAERASEGAPLDWTEYARLSRRWELSSAVALLAPLGALLLMVAKVR